jgi:hypothetical protein
MVLDGKESEHFKIYAGVRQGIGLSLMLFNMVMDEIMTVTEEQKSGILKITLCADNIVTE